MPLKPIGEMPKNSKAMDMVFAVNCPPHEPAPGQACVSKSWSSASDILLWAWAPTASKTS